MTKTSYIVHEDPCPECKHLGRTCMGDFGKTGYSCAIRRHKCEKSSGPGRPRKTKNREQVEGETAYNAEDVARSSRPTRKLDVMTSNASSSCLGGTKRKAVDVGSRDAGKNQSELADKEVEGVLGGRKRAREEDGAYRSQRGLAKDPIEDAARRFLDEAGRLSRAKLEWERAECELERVEQRRASAKAELEKVVKEWQDRDWNRNRT
jgi:hypothetical protein